MARFEGTQSHTLILVLRDEQNILDHMYENKLDSDFYEDFNFLMASLN